MSHCDDDELSVIALGEVARPEDEAHLATCSRCRSRLDQLSAVVGTARTITDADHPVSPPDYVWNSIVTELDLQPADELAARRARNERRTASRWLIPAAAAILGVVVGGVVTSQVINSSPAPAVMATGSLDPIGESGLAGTAMIEESPDGATLVVSVNDLPAAEDGYYEVWMASPDTTTMVAIGTLNPGQEARFSLPQGMSVTAFPVVDVSLEHFDGDTGHSATSIVRGTLSS